MSNSERVLDYVSAFNLALISYPFLQFTLTGDFFFVVFSFSIIVCHLVTAGLKRLTASYVAHPAFLRPLHARNCDIMCRNGLVGGKPGFPSGHMSSTALFCTLIILYKYRVTGSTKFELMVLGAVAFAFTMLTALARFYKGCHNIIQIGCGTVLGVVLGFTAFEAYQSMGGKTI